MQIEVKDTAQLSVYVTRERHTPGKKRVLSPQ
jgi:hypothetical protein